MSKLEWPSLLPNSGPHPLSYEQLQQLIMTVNTRRRTDLTEGFASLFSVFLDAGLHGLDLWVDGSYLSEKPCPKDVDCVLWLPESAIKSASDQHYRELIGLKNRAAIRARFGVDLYIAPPEETRNIAYWQTCFGTCHDDITAKGYAVVTI